MLDRLFRSLARFVFALATILVATSLTRAQRSPDDLPTFYLSASVVGLDSAPELYWAEFSPVDPEAEPRYRRLNIGIGSRSSATSIAITRQLALYKKVMVPSPPPQPGQPALPPVEKMQPVIQMPSVSEGDRLLLLFYRDLEGKPTFTFLNDDTNTHPRQAVRFLNLSDDTIAATVGNEPTMIRPGESGIVGIPRFQSPRTFELDYAVQHKDGTSFRAPTKRFRYRNEDSRLLMVYAPFPIMKESDPNDEEPAAREIAEFKAMAYKLFDSPRDPE